MITFIIPFKNEAEQIKERLTFWQELIDRNHELIFVNDSSTDNGPELICNLKAVFLTCNLKNGARAFALGLNSAKSQYACFLPVDCCLSSEAITELELAISRNFLWISFPKKYIDGKSNHFYLFLQNVILAKFFKIISWTNLPVFQRELFSRVGELANDGFLSDLEISRVFNKIPRLQLRSFIFVSSRRYQDNGNLIQIWRNFKILFLWFFKLSNNRKALQIYTKK